MRFESLMFSANQKNKEWTAITQSVSDEMGYEVLCCQQTPAIFRSSVVFLWGYHQPNICASNVTC